MVSELMFSSVVKNKLYHILDYIKPGFSVNTYLILEAISLNG